MSSVFLIPIEIFHNTLNLITIVSEDSKIYAEMIKELDFHDLDLTACDTVEDAKKYVEDCNIILGKPVLIAPVLEAAKRLQRDQSTWAGADALLYRLP